MHYDEFLTAERSREIWIKKDIFTVYDGFAPSYSKPPLQYWLTALTLKLAKNHREWAVRFWSAVFGSACLAAVYWLTQVILPQNRWAPVFASLITALNALVVAMSRLALLDAGQAFLVTATVAAGLSALTKADRWLLAGFLAGLTSLLKAPLGVPVFLFLGCYAFLKQREKINRFFWCGLAIMVLLASLWPLSQYLSHGPAYVHQFFGKELVNRVFNKGHVGSRYHPYQLSVYLRLLYNEWSFIAILILLALPGALWLSIKRRNSELLPAALLGVLSLIFLSLMTDRRERYLLFTIPLLSAVGVSCIYLLFPKNRLLSYWILVLVIFSAKTLGHSSVFENESGFHKNFPNDAYTAQDLGKVLKKNEKTVVIEEADMLDDVFLFYGDLSGPLSHVSASEINHILLWKDLNLRGLAHEKSFLKLQTLLPNARIESRHGNAIHWSYTP